MFQFTEKEVEVNPLLSDAEITDALQKFGI